MKYKVALLDNKDGTGKHLWEHVAKINWYRLKIPHRCFRLHMNAGGGTGCECWIPKGNKYARKLATFNFKKQVKIGRPLHERP